MQISIKTLENLFDLKFKAEKLVKILYKELGTIISM